MKNIVLTAASHMAAAEIEGIEFARAASDSPEDQRAAAQLVDDAKAEVILRNEWFAEAPPEKPADKPADAPPRTVAPAAIPAPPASSEPAK